MSGEARAQDPEVDAGARRYSVVKADDSDPREWLQAARICPLLSQHHIVHVGVMEARQPFEVVRRELTGTFMLACYEGEGVVLTEGKWKRLRAGQACLQPPFVMNALRCLPGRAWKFAWVRYRESRESMPIVSSLSPLVGEFDAEPLRAAIGGLHAESGAAAGLPAALHHWCELVHHYVLRFAQPRQPDDRLWRVWQQAEADLARNWTLAELAAIACVSEEHLRRLSRKQLGRSPMQHLTFLRLQRARHLLSTTDDKVEIVSREVGFESVSAFSNTFKKWIGWRPSELRRGSGRAG
jgi:AraC-like DNA-binding protein